MNNLSTRLRATWNPDMYHGWGKKRKYFEGWYFKVVSKDERHAFAFIPGISFGEDGTAHAFIQVLNGKKCTAEYHDYEAKDFQPSSERFELKLGDNFFSGDKIKLKVPGISGELNFKNTTPWPKMLGAPGIMGWYSFVPFMQCFHGVVSMHHLIEGALEIDGETIDFTGGIGYIEKDWGQSFPKAYVWMQTNHFDAGVPVSMMGSAAHIPWLGNYFVGFIGGFWLEDRLFKFATYTGAKKYLEIGEETVQLIFKNRKTELRINAQKGPSGELISPLLGDMKGKINESLQATAETQLLENGKIIFEGIGRNVGLEVAGEIEVIVDKPV